MSRSTTFQSTLKPDPLLRPALAIAAFLAVAVTLAAVGRYQAGRAPVAVSAAMQMLALRFIDQPDGTVVAMDATTGRALETVAIGQGGFIRVTMRSFALERKQRGIGAEVPFMLTRHADGRLVLSDETTGRTMLLNAFGPSNEGVFAELIDKSR